MRTHPTLLAHLLSLGLLASLAACSTGGQSHGPSLGLFAQPAAAANPAQPATPAILSAADLKQALGEGVAHLLSMQEGEPQQEWPYQGVYRVRGEIPVGYRIGGTAIVTLALAQAPGYDTDQPRQEAVARALEFICAARERPQMTVGEGRDAYDVRAWGYIEATWCLARLKRLNLIPASSREACDAALAHYTAAIQTHEIPGAGGWNYAESGRNPSSFMTSHALLALFEAAAAGEKVDPAIVDRAVAFLKKTQTPSGSIVYSGVATARALRSTADGVPGAVGRMNIVNTALLLAGPQGREGEGAVSPAIARGGVDAFITHWDWLDQRRAKTGTHERPYMVAPYYFMFAHHAAAMAVEQLPANERDEYRRRINGLLFSVRADNGSWNDRVFPRSSAYGTAMAMLAIMQPDLAPPAAWTPAAQAQAPAQDVPPKAEPGESKPLE